MRIDWERYRAECAEKRKAVLLRFRDMLQSGAEISTVQSAPVCTGALTAALVTVLRQMTDLLQNGYLSGTGCSTVPADGERIRRAVRRSYFLRLSEISSLKIAQEYVRTHFRCQEPCEEEMTAWLFSFQGQRDSAAELVRRIDEETDMFIREEMPKILEACKKDAGESHRRFI